MKTRFLILLLSAIANLSLAQGIEFFEGSLEEALAKAKLEDKLIFVDAYTTWCGPCKAMSKNVFTDVNVGEFYNKSFINLKIDQEKGEGLDFAKKYNVRFYPTFVFINSEGEMAHKAVGYIEVEDFILLGAAATNDNYQLLSLQNKYDKGDKNSRVLKNLANALSEAYMDNSEEIALEYLATQTDWKNDENIAFIYKHFPSDIESEVFYFIVKERALFEAYVENPEAIDARINHAIEKSLEANKISDDEEINLLFMKYFAEEGLAKAEDYKIKVLMTSQKPENLKEAFTRKIAWFKDYPSNNWQELNAFAWTVYENSDDKGFLQEAQDLALQSIRIDENYYNTDTYTWISYKLKDYKNAKLYGEKAIVLGKEDGSDVSELEAMLKKLP